VARIENGELHGRIETLTTQLDVIHASRSWRLTRVLRVLGRLLRGEVAPVRDGLRRAFKRNDG
jgi:hypothetical protein